MIRQVRTETQGSRLKLSFEIANDSREAWPLLGYQIFDPRSETLLVEGPRLPLDLAPGASRHVQLDIALPEEGEPYRVFVSPLREGHYWFYDRGVRFLVLEGGRGRVTTRRALAARTLLRAAGRAFTYPLASLWRNRSLIRGLVRRDVLGRYRGSFGGVFWTVLHPLLLILTYFFVFGVVLEARFGKDPSRAGFALYFLAGMLPWLAFSEAVGRAATVLTEHRNFVKKLVFPVETLPVNLVLAGLATQAFALLLFTAGLFLARGEVPTSVLWLPVLLAPQVLFTAGLCWLLAALGVFVRDLGPLMGFVLTVWFFLTPICYPEASLPSWALPVLRKNPLFALVRGYRDIFLEGRAPAPGPLWKLALLAAATFIVGHAVFHKLRRSFADVI